MTEKLEKILLRIMEYDHQNVAQDVLINAPCDITERAAAYYMVLDQVAQTDIQAWARAALAEIKQIKEQGQ